MSTKYIDSVNFYYDTCWLERFKEGHNPKSLAMHMGYFITGEENNDQAKQKMNDFLADQINIKNQEELTVVDVGCGVGGSLKFLSERYPQHNYVGVNISASQIAMVRAYLKDTTVKLLTEDYASTSLENASVDVIYGIESICHAKSKEDFCKEAFRVLRPGGKLVIIDYLQNDSLKDEQTLLHLQKFRDGWSVDNYMVGPESLLNNVGFDEVSKKSLLDNVRPGIEKSFVGANTKMTQLNGSLNPVVKKHLNACISLKRLVDLGEIDYCIITAQKPL